MTLSPYDLCCWWDVKCKQTNTYAIATIMGTMIILRVVCTNRLVDQMRFHIESLCGRTTVIIDSEQLASADLDLHCFQKRIYTIKHVLSNHSNKDRKLAFKNNYRLMQVKSITECSKGAFCNTFDLHSATICQ